MAVFDNAEAAQTCREMTPLQQMRSRASVWLVRFRRKLPHLVWYGDEVDVTVTLSEDKLNPADPLGSFNRGALRAIEVKLNEMGIDFDRGQGFDGRDWEWDWSLKGPIHIKFRRRAKRPEQRV